MINSSTITNRFWKIIEKITPKSLFTVLPSLLDITLLGVVFLIIDFWFKWLTKINPFDFNEVVLATSPTQFFKGSSWLLIPGVLLVVLLVVKYKLLKTRWDDLQGGKSLRLLIGICTCLLAWAHATYPFQFFLNEITFIERPLIVLIALFVLWRPFFLFAFLFLPLVFHYQEPFLISHWSITELPIRILVLFSAQMTVWLLFSKKRWQIQAFVFMMLCILAGNYFPAGIGKVLIGWLSEDRMYYLLPNMYADGWMGFLSQETISSITQFLSKFNLLLKTSALIIEVGCVLLLFRKTQSIRFFLVGFLIFHTLVFIMTGILFLYWALFEITLLVILNKRKTIYTITQQFSIWHILVSIFLIATSPKWLRPSEYVWYDSPISYTYTFEVEDTQGKTWDLPSHYFWPKYYEHAFVNDFHFIHDTPTLDITWGVSLDAFVVGELHKLKTKDQVLSFEKQHAKNHLQIDISNEFRRYITHFIKTKQYKRTQNFWFRAISAPPQRIIFPLETTYNGEHDIIKIRVFQEMAFFNGEIYQEVRRNNVYNIDILENNSK